MASNIEVVLAGFDAWNRQDLDGWLAILHPDVELHPAGVFPDSEPVYRGHREIADFWRSMHDPWDTLRLDVEQIEERGDWVVYAFRFHAHGVGSGTETDLRFANAVRFSGGLEIEVVARRTLDEARQVVLQAEGEGFEPSVPR